MLKVYEIFGTQKKTAWSNISMIMKDMGVHCMQYEGVLGKNLVNQILLSFWGWRGEHLIKFIGAEKSFVLFFFEPLWQSMMKSRHRWPNKKLKKSRRTDAWKENCVMSKCKAPPIPPEKLCFCAHCPGHNGHNRLAAGGRGGLLLHWPHSLQSSLWSA